jgi:hypothetical protein
MARPIAQCALCHEVKPLASSHLIPAGCWDRMRDGTNSPFMMTKDAVLTSDRQLQDYLLCDDCELLLSEGGENYVLPLLASQGQKFPLYDLLKANVPHTKLSEGMEVFDVGDNRHVPGRKILHFAMGIFWKAAAHVWKLSGGEVHIDLGEYQEPFRQCVMGAIRWPGEDVNVYIYLSKPEQLPILRISPPGPYIGAPGVTAFSFEVPGMDFVLQIGPGQTQEDKAMAYSSGPNHKIMVHDARSQLVFAQNRQRESELRQTKSFLRAQERRKMKPSYQK